MTAFRPIHHLDRQMLILAAVEQADPEAVSTFLADYLIQDTPTQRLKTIFHSPGHTMRLTTFGDEQLSKLYGGGFTVKLGSDTLTMRERLVLANKCRLPYFLSFTVFRTFDRMLGVKLKLADGDVERVKEVLFR